MSSPSPSPLRSSTFKKDAGKSHSNGVPSEKAAVRGAAFRRGNAASGDFKPHAVPPAEGRHHPADPATSRARLPGPIPKRLVTAEPPNLRLDPFGVAGTGTARRLRTARLRRQWQLLLGTLVIVAFCGVGVGILVRRQEPMLSATPAPEVPFVQSAPAAVAGDVAYVPALDGSLWSIAPRRGAGRKFGGESGLFPARVAPLVTASRAYLPSLDGILTAFDTRSHRALWHQKLGGSLSTTPTSWGRGVIVAANDTGQILALRASDGHRLWLAQANGPVGDALAATREGILVPSLPSAHGRGALECFDGRNGNRRWRFPDNILDAAPGVTAPLFDASRNVVFWASDYGFVVALNATTGAKRWKTFATPLSGADSRTVTLRGAPALWNDTLLVGGNDGTVRAFDAQSGRPRWVKRLKGAVTLPARFVQCDGQTVASVSDGGSLVLLNLSNGSIVRRLAVGNGFGASWVATGGWMQDAQHRTWHLGAS